MMKISELTEQLLQGKELIKKTYSAKTHGMITLKVDTKYSLGEIKITESQFNSLKSNNKLKKEIDRSNSFITVYTIAL